uniref:ACT domain-containing protein n=1 Tax=Aureoumbra lagunensis TaxID=44058 RepID=A0A7S3NQY7_9STRA|mmetsp:Transcript_21009/g.27241  ORF Transcript_21009/g.27241 Transcript_21009/m.27241 type:complete len:253 (-) Transcript_21009:113-871(-)
MLCSFLKSSSPSSYLSVNGTTPRLGIQRYLGYQIAKMSEGTARDSRVSFMPPGSVPQFFVRIEGKHHTGVLKDISKSISQAKASIASLQKISFGSKFVALMHLWIPPTELESRHELIKNLELTLGPDANCLIEAIDKASQERYINTNHEEKKYQESRLRITCNDEPGIIFLITDLLTAQGCVIGKVEANTSLHTASEKNILKFNLDAIVRVDSNKIEAIQRELKLITELNHGLSILFEANAVSAHINLVDCA